MKHSISGLFIALLLAGLVSACAPHVTAQPSYSFAFGHPERTRLGRDFGKAEQAHRGLSGFGILNNSLDGFAARAELIAKAQVSLDLQYFVFREDQSGKVLTAQLLDAADRGVRIRILVDDGNTVDGDEQLLTLAAHPNIQVRVFNPFGYRGHSLFVRLLEAAIDKNALDYRMHNKLFVADNAVALVGGRNIGDVYFQVSRDRQFGDDDVLTVGPMVRQLSQSFDQFWNSDRSVPATIVDPELATPVTLANFRQQLAANLEQLEQRRDSFIQQVRAGVIDNTGLVWATAKLVYDSPDKKDVEDDRLPGSLIYESVKDAIESVRSELAIITPFLVPGAEGMKLLRTLQDRHVSTRILTNSLEAAPELFAQSGYSRYRKRLLQLGVALYEIRAKPGKGAADTLDAFGRYGLHAKQYIFDRRKVFLGSMNFDQRSIHLNTEIGLVIDSPELARQALQRFDRLTDPSDSYQVLLKTGHNGAKTLVWRTKEQGGLVDYTSEPSAGSLRLIKEDLLSILPLDEEL